MDETQFELPTEDDVPDMSDDDIASALGFATTLSEPMLPQDEMTTGEDEGEETADESGKTAEDAAEDPEAMSKDDAQDAEIADIRMQLEQLLGEESDEEGKEEPINDEPETEDTDTTGQA